MATSRPLVDGARTSTRTHPLTAQMETMVRLPRVAWFGPPLCLVKGRVRDVNKDKAALGHLPATHGDLKAALAP